MYPGLLGILINLIAYQLYSFKFTFTFNNLNFDYDEFTKCLFIMLYIVSIYYHPDFIIFMSFISILYFILLDDDFWKILLIITGLLNIINIKKKMVITITPIILFSISYFLSALICDIYLYNHQTLFFYIQLNKLHEYIKNIY
jgi:hypothetical protein